MGTLQHLNSVAQRFACHALLRRDALCPSGGPSAGESLLDILDAESHKHDAGVSKDLKYALRDAIELLGNEAARQLIAAHGYTYPGTVKRLSNGLGDQREIDVLRDEIASQHDVKPTCRTDTTNATSLGVVVLMQPDGDLSAYQVVDVREPEEIADQPPSRVPHARAIRRDARLRHEPPLRGPARDDRRFAGPAVHDLVGPPSGSPSKGRGRQPTAHAHVRAR